MRWQVDMSRTSTAIVAGITLLGCIVALVPAQESSRRTASKYKPTSAADAGERTSLAPLNPSEPALPPVVPPPTQPAAAASGWAPASPAPLNPAAQQNPLPPGEGLTAEPGTLN